MKDFNVTFDSCLKSYYRTVSLYFKYLHLGFYYENVLLAEIFSHYKRNKASSEALNNEDNQTIYSFFLQDLDIPSLEIPFADTDKMGLLYNSVINNAIQEVLSEINNKKQSFFCYLIFVSSLFAISKATAEALDKNNKFEKIVKEEIFPHNLDMYEHFKAAIDVVRNTLAHNFYSKPIISDERILDIVVRKHDFRKNKLRKIKFIYDYSSPISGMYYPYIHRKISIDIDLDLVTDGMSYHELISLDQSFLLMFFCYDMGCKLGDKYLKGQQY